MSCYQPPELLAVRHQLAGFRCRSVEQTAWLVEVAKQAHGAGTTRVFVVTEVNHTAVVAYYAWCMAIASGSAAAPSPCSGGGLGPVLPFQTSAPQPASISRCRLSQPSGSSPRCTRRENTA